MKSRWSKYVKEPFLRTLREIPWFGPVVSALLVTMAVDLLTQAVTSWGGVWLAWAVVLAMVVVAVAFVYAYALSESRRRERGIDSLVDLPNPAKKQGLIFLFSREEPLREAIKYHQPVLTHCWLLVTPEMQERANQAIQHLADLSFSLHALPGRYDSQACYQTVRDIYQREAPRLGIPPQNVIADITGGTKPMTLGMIVACMENQAELYPIEHIPTAFDVEGRPKGPLPPIQIIIKAAERAGLPNRRPRT